MPSGLLHYAVTRRGIVGAAVGDAQEDLRNFLDQLGRNDDRGAQGF